MGDTQIRQPLPDELPGVACQESRCARGDPNGFQSLRYINALAPGILPDILQAVESAGHQCFDLCGFVHRGVERHGCDHAASPVMTEWMNSGDPCTTCSTTSMSPSFSAMFCRIVTCSSVVAAIPITTRTRPLAQGMPSG